MSRLRFDMPVPRLSNATNRQNVANPSNIRRIAGHSHAISMFCAIGGTETIVTSPSPMDWYAIDDPLGVWANRVSGHGSSIHFRGPLSEWLACGSRSPMSGPLWPRPCSKISIVSCERCQTVRIDSVRIDQWLHAVRITKTRSGAAAACRGGHVSINGATARPSSPVRVGDHVEARVNQRERIVDVTKVITKRVDARSPPNASTITARPHPNETTFRNPVRRA